MSLVSAEGMTEKGKLKKWCKSFNSSITISTSKIPYEISWNPIESIKGMPSLARARSLWF